MKNYYILAILPLLLAFNLTVLTQEDIRNHLFYSETVTVDFDLEIRYPLSSLVYAIENSEILLLNKRFIDAKDGSYRLEGFTFNTTDNHLSKFEIEFENRSINQSDQVASIALDSNFLLINFQDVQLLFVKNKSEYIIIDEFSFQNINDAVALNNQQIKLIRTGFFHKSEDERESIIGIIDREINEDSIIPIQLQGNAFSNLQPAKFAAINNLWTAWVDPTSYQLNFINNQDKTFHKINNPHDNWNYISDSKLKNLQKFRDLSDQASLLRKYNSEISRVWEIQLIDTTSLLVRYHQVVENKMLFYVDVWKYRQGKWNLHAKSISIDNREKIQNNFKNNLSLNPKIMGLGNLTIWLNNHILILSEENDKPAYSNYPENSNSRNGLKVHIFEQTLY